jgi:hypothetical protein
VRKTKAAGLIAALIGAVALLFLELGGRSEHQAKRARPATGSLFDVGSTPPTFVAKGRPVTLTYDIVCELPADRPPTPSMLKTFCIPRGTLHVRRVGEPSFDEYPMTAKRHRAIALVPAEYAAGTGFEYYVELQDERGGTATVPEGGAEAPARARVVGRWTTVRLGRHTFGDTRQPDAILVRAGWGSGRGKFGADVGKEQAAIGPSAFDVAPDGSIVVLDQLKRRLVIFQKGSQKSPRRVRIRFRGGEGDLTVSPNGAMYVLDSDGGGADPAVQAYDASGHFLYYTRAPGSPDMVRAGPEGPIVHSFPSEMWFPVGNSREPLDHAQQIAGVLSGQATQEGEVLVHGSSDHEARYELLGPQPNAWHVTSSTYLGGTDLAEPYGRGLAVVTKLYTETKDEFLFLHLTPEGLSQSFTIDSVEALDANASGTFRLRGDTLYQFRRYPTRLEIVAYRLR